MAKQMTATFETWTPESARDQLENGGDNRKLKSARVAQYASAMRAGSWSSNGESVKISTRGKVMDGQHRLHAVIEAGVKVEMLTVRNVVPSAMNTVDDGYKRTTAHVLHIKGYKNTTALAHALNLAVRWEKGDLNTLRQRNLSTRPRRDEQMAALKRNEGLIEILNDTSTAYQKIMQRSVFAFAWYLISSTTQSGEAYKTRTFFTSLGDGAMLSQGDPVYLLRERLIASTHAERGKRLDTTSKLQLIIKAWNAYISGENIERLRLPKHDDIPEVM